jgi:hypothetical protein
VHALVEHFRTGSATTNDKSVVTKVAAFARDFSPQLPGDRIAIPD